MSAGSLIDESALPGWLRAEAAAPSPAQQPAASAPATGASTYLHPFGSPATIDEPMPSWLNQVYKEANVPRIGTGQMGGDPWAAAPTIGQPVTSNRPGSNALPASALVEESALPDWLRSQGAQPTGAVNPPGSAGVGSWQSNAQVAPQMPAYVPGNQSRALGGDGGSGSVQFAASDLIDPEALPSWVRGDATQQAAFSSTLGWTSKQQAVSASSGAFGSALPGAGSPPGSGMVGYGGGQQHAGGYYSGRSPGGPEASPWSSGGSAALGGQFEGRSGALGGDSSGALDPRFSGPLDPRYSDELKGQSSMLGDGHSGRLPQEDGDVPPHGSDAFHGYSRRFVPEDKYEPPAESSAAQRRGQPIPFEELPPWLRNAGPQHGGAGAYAHAHVDEPEEEEWWPDDEQAGAQWNDWGDGEYAGDNGGYGGYDGYDGYEEQGEDEYTDERKRGGWRRFFGRR